MRITKQKTFESAKKNCPIGGTAFSCMPTVENMRKGRKTKVGYIRGTHLSEIEIYQLLNGCGISAGNPCLVFYNQPTNQPTRSEK